MPGIDDRQSRKAKYLQSFGEGSDNNHQQVRVSRKNAEHEHLVVKFVMNRLKLGHQIPEVMQLWELQTGLHELRFSAFNELFPTFPFLLGSDTLKGVAVPWTHDETRLRKTPLNYAVYSDPYSTEPARFKKFGWVPFVVAYTRFYESVTTAVETRKVCMQYPRLGFVQGMCIHDDDSEQFWTAGLSWVYKYTGGGRDRRLYMVPFQDLIEAIYNDGHGWRPD